MLAFLAISIADQAQQSTAFLHVHVIPMDRERVLDDQTVVVANGRIAQIGPSSSIKIPAAAKTIDATGKYLIPRASPTHTFTSTRPSNSRSIWRTQ